MAQKQTMKWDAEADAKLFGLFLNVFEVKISKDMMKTMNAVMGLDPGSQAIAHRIGAARKRAASLISDIDKTAIKPIPLTPRGPKRGASTPGSRSATRSKKGLGGKKELEDDSDDSGLDSPTVIQRARSARTSAALKRSYKNSDTEDSDNNDGSEYGDSRDRTKRAKKGKLGQRDSGQEEGDGGNIELSREQSVAVETQPSLSNGGLCDVEEV